jgi:hypothetical protein
MAFANGRTWGNATFGDNHSWTNASVSSGLLTVDKNTVTAGASTSGVQDVRISGGSGDAWVGSTDGTNYTEVGAEFTSGSLSESWVLVPLGFYRQETHTGSSAYATQSGFISATSGTGNTWGNAISGDNHSWTNASVVSGTLNVDENSMTAGTSTSGVQDVGISALGGSGNAWVGSTDGTNYAKAGSGFNSGQLSMNQQTNATSGAYASQTGTIESYSTVLGGAWTWTEAGDTSSNRFAYIETKAASGSTITGAKGVRITETSTAFSSAINTTVYEQKSRARIIWALSGGQPSSTTYTFADNGDGSPVNGQNSVLNPTTGWAWASATDKFAQWPI